MSEQELPEENIVLNPCPSCNGNHLHISKDRTVWYCEDCEWQAEDIGD
jgi:ribosomal protein L37AE/L43A